MAASRTEAIIYAAESLKERFNEVQANGSLEVRVTDDLGLNLFQVTMIVTNAGQADRQGPPVAVSPRAA